MKRTRSSAKMKRKLGRFGVAPGLLPMILGVPRDETNRRSTELKEKLELGISLPEGQNVLQGVQRLVISLKQYLPLDGRRTRHTY